VPVISMHVAKSRALRLDAAADGHANPINRPQNLMGFLSVVVRVGRGRQNDIHIVDNSMGSGDALELSAR